MKKGLLLTLLFSLVLLAIIMPEPAGACSCVPPRTPGAEFDQASAVFSGRVLEQHELTLPNIENPVQVSLQTYRVWKGTALSRIAIRTGGGSASCGYPFQPGQEYLVYGFDYQGDLTTNICWRTRLLGNAGEDLAALGEGQTIYTPSAIDAFLANWPIILLSLLGLILLIIAFIRRRSLQS